MRTRVVPSSSILPLIGVLAGSLIGCGGDPDKPKLARASGKVTYNGKPVHPGSVIFNPAGGEKTASQLATGQLESDGSFTLTTFNTGDGAVIGQHVVTVEARGGDLNELNKPKADGTIAYVLPKPQVPEKYTQAGKSPLRYTVEADKSNYFEIDLSGDLGPDPTSAKKKRR